MSKAHDSECECQEPGGDCCCSYRAEIERLRGLVDACAIYLKEDETPAQRIERERADTDAVLKILLKEKREVERLRDELAERALQIDNLRELVYAVPPTENMTGQTWQEAAYANREEVARLDNMLRTYRPPDEVVDIKVVIELRTEIARLRGLLREVADYSGDSGVVERVREALASGNPFQTGNG